MKILSDGTIIFTARSGNQAVIKFQVSSNERTLVADVAWTRPEKPSDRRECNKAVAAAFPNITAISATGTFEESERRALAAHALTHGVLPDGVEVENVRGKAPRAVDAIKTMLGVLLLTTQLAASPLLSDGDEPTSLQYWYTVSVPQEHGVYPVEVFAPALPALFAQHEQVLVLDEALRLVETPEPGTTVQVVLCIAGAVSGWLFWPWLRTRIDRHLLTRRIKLARRQYERGLTIPAEQLFRELDEKDAKRKARKALEE